MTERPKRDIDICSKCKRFMIRDSDAMFPMGYWCKFEYGENVLRNPRFLEKGVYSEQLVPGNCPYETEHKISDWSKP